MTLEEKYNKLSEMCDKKKYCVGCIVHRKFPQHSCGRGHSYDDMKSISEEEVEKIYSYVFGDTTEQKESAWYFPKPEESSKKPEQPEEINHPDRYNSNGYECIDVMQAIFGLEAVKNFCKLNAFKYIWRADKKGHNEDCKKAIWYLNKYIELEERGNEEKPSE